MNLNGYPVELNPAIRDQEKENQICKEQFLFMALCSDGDRELILSKKEMRIQDFDRIQCLMSDLGLENLHSHFLMEHADLMSVLGKQLEEDQLTDSDIDQKMREMSQWYREFLEQLPSEKVRYFISKVLSV